MGHEKNRRKVDLPAALVSRRIWYRQGKYCVGADASLAARVSALGGRLDCASLSLDLGKVMEPRKSGVACYGVPLRRARRW